MSPPSEHPHMQRIQIVQRNPNPLFVSWLEQWLVEAKQKKFLSKYSLAKALKSMQLYPFVLHTGYECRGVLKGFGPKICQRLDRQLAVYRQTTALPTVADLERSDREVLEKVRSETARRQRLERANTATAESAVGAINQHPDMLALYQKYDQQASPVRPRRVETTVVPDRTSVASAVLPPVRRKRAKKTSAASGSAVAAKQQKYDQLPSTSTEKGRTATHR